MLKTLHIKNLFTHKDRRFDFGLGTTCITGPNEGGKSLILEAIEYALFGSSALRGTADDYKDLYVSLDFQVKGVDYRIVRDRSKALLERDGEPLASGTRPVNAAIVRVLGYDRGVFRMANLCGQGQVEALGAMKPAERKKAVDQTIGLSVLDGLSKWAGEQAAGFTREADTLERTLVVPVVPIQPEDYLPSASTKCRLAVADDMRKERIQIQAWLNNPPHVPTKPVLPCEEDIATLQAAVSHRAGLARTVAELKRQADTIPEASLTEAQIAEVEEQWSAFHLWEERNRALAGLVSPTVTREQVEEDLLLWDAYDRYQRKLKLEQHLTTCPACSHSWADDAAWDEVKGAEAVPTPLASRAALEHTLRQLDAWEASAEVRAKYANVTEVQKPPLSEAQLRTARNALAEADRKAKLQVEMRKLAEEFAGLPDRQADLMARQKFEVELRAWAAAVERETLWLAEKATKEARLAEIGDIDTVIAKVQAEYEAALVYEREWATFETARQRYEELAGQLQAARKKADDWTKARKALGELRGRVKQYLLPSLNTVASVLLAKMTGGKRQSIVVDDDFDILVDGLAVQKLSGSGKACANLALRIALGMVLTNRVFSVFMGDELDASMDKDRAGFTAEALAGLTETIGQVVVVSHKPFEADNDIDLGAMAA